MLRDREGREVELESYSRFQSPLRRQRHGLQVVAQVLGGVLRLPYGNAIRLCGVRIRTSHESPKATAPGCQSEYDAEPMCVGTQTRPNNVC